MGVQFIRNMADPNPDKMDMGVQIIRNPAYEGNGLCPLTSREVAWKSGHRDCFGELGCFCMFWVSRPVVSVFESLMFSLV